MNWNYDLHEVYVAEQLRKAEMERLAKESQREEELPRRRWFRR